MRCVLAALLSALLAAPAWAARDFDGVDDDVNFGSDASIDAFALKTICMWIAWDGTGVLDAVTSKINDTGTTGWIISTHSATNTIRFAQSFSGTDGDWRGSTAMNDAVARHVCIVYDSGATGNVPTIYVNGTAETLTTIATPTGTVDSDAANMLCLGEFGAAACAGGSDFDGRVAWYTYDNTLWGAADVNRARWWGRKGGVTQVCHPFITDKLTNEGTATANGTATGTTNVSMPKAPRGVAIADLLRGLTDLAAMLLAAGGIDVLPLPYL